MALLKVLLGILRFLDASLILLYSVISPSLEITTTALEHTSADAAAAFLLHSFGSQRPFSIAWLTLTLSVTHSKLSFLGSVFIVFLWLTWGRLSGLGMNNSATALCGNNIVGLLLAPLERLTLDYPLLLGLSFNILPVLSFLILPWSDTE